MAVRPAIVREVKHGRGLMELRGKLALVTGGSDGIGREIALQLQGAGAGVIVTGRSAEKLRAMRSEEHTSELQSLMRISYAVFCLKKNKNKGIKKTTQSIQQIKPNNRPLTQSTTTSTP